MENWYSSVSMEKAKRSGSDTSDAEDSTSFSGSSTSTDIAVANSNSFQDTSDISTCLDEKILESKKSRKQVTYSKTCQEDVLKCEGYVKVADVSVGPCPCFVQQADPHGLRNFQPPNSFSVIQSTDSTDVVRLRQNYGTITKQCTSLQEEVDRLQASLSLLSETKIPLSPEKEVKVVLYGDMGSALVDELSQDSLSSSLYTLNVNLLHKLEMEKKKVCDTKEDRQAMTDKLESLIAMVNAFQKRFEERMVQLHENVPRLIADGTLDRSERAESGFDDSMCSELTPSRNFVELEEESTDYLERTNMIPVIRDSAYAKGSEVALTAELRNIVGDLRKVLTDVSIREERWCEERQSWALFSTNVCARLTALWKLIVELTLAYRNHRSSCYLAFSQLKNDILTLFTSLRNVPALLFAVVEARQSTIVESSKIQSDQLGSTQVQDKVRSWQEKSCQVEDSEECQLEELQKDYAVLEERFQSAVKRFQICTQEKFLVESCVEKLKDDIQLIQYEKESLLRRNERVLMALNTVQNEKAIVETSLSSFSAELENASAARYALESVSVELRTAVADLKAEKDSLLKEKNLSDMEKEQLLKTISLRDLELQSTKDELATSSQLARNLLHDLEIQSERINVVGTELIAEKAESTILHSKIEEQDQQIRKLLSSEKELLQACEAKHITEVSLQKCLNTIATLEDDLAREKLVSSYLNESLDETNQKLIRAEEEKSTTLAMNFALQKKLADASKVIQDLKLENIDAVNNATIKINAIVEETEMKDKELLLIKRTLATRDLDFATMTAELQSLKEVEVGLQESQKVIQLLKSDLGRAESALYQSSGMIEQKTASVDQLELDLQQKINWIGENQREIDFLHAENVELKLELAGKRRDLESTRVALGFAQEEASRAEEECLRAVGLANQQQAEVEKKNIAFIEQIAHLSGQLQLNSDNLSKERSARATLEANLLALSTISESSNQRIAHLEEQQQFALKDLIRLQCERDFLDDSLRDYSCLINIVATAMEAHTVAPDNGLSIRGNHASHGDRSRHHVSIFTPDGIVEVDDDREEEVLPGTAENGLDENDSGFVGSSIHVEGEEMENSPMPVHQSLANVDSVNLLIRKLEDQQSEEFLATHPASATLFKDVNHLHSALYALESNRTNVDHLVKSLTSRLDDQFSQREQLIQERDKFSIQVAHLNMEIHGLKKEIDHLQSAKTVSDREARANDKIASELKLLLHDRELEVDRLRRRNRESSSQFLEIEHKHAEEIETKCREFNHLKEELKLSHATLEELSKQNARHEGRIRDLLNRIMVNETTIADLTQQLRETENHSGTMDTLKAKEEALCGLERSLDMKILQVQEREAGIRKLELQVATFVTDQLELADREADVLQKTHELETRRDAIAARERELEEKLEISRNSEKSHKELENELIINQDECDKVRAENELFLLDVEKSQTMISVMEKRLRDYDNQVCQLAKIYDDVDTVVHKQEDEIESLRTLYNNAQKHNNELEKLLSHVKNENERLRTSSDSKESENTQLKDQIQFLSLSEDKNQQEIKNLRDVLAERSTQLANLATEEKRLKLLLQKTESRLESKMSILQDLEHRLQNKIFGQGSLQEQFSALNLLYADTAEKYRKLSEAYDEMEIMVVRNRDQYRDAKRELDKLSYLLVKHLHKDIDANLKDEKTNDELLPTITRKMISVVRADVEELLATRLVNSNVTEIQPSTAFRVKSLKKASQRRSASNRVRSPLQTTGGSDENDFRHLVMQRLFENSSLDNIVQEEVARGLLHNPPHTNGHTS